VCSIPGFQAHVSCLVPWALSFDQEKPLERALLVQHYYASCACKTHVFVSVCSQVMKGRGGVGGHVNVPCTIFPLHVATLHRCLVVLLRMKGWGGGGGM